MTLPEIRAGLEHTLESVTTVEALFERLNLEAEVAVIPYAAMLVLRTLRDPISQPMTTLAGDLTIPTESAKVIYGSATIAGPVQNDGALVVFGDLTIGNIYGDAAWSYSLLAVGGALQARGVMSFGDMLVRGDLLVSDIVHAWYNEYTLAVGGILRTRVLLEEYHSTRYTTLDVQETAHLYQRIRLSAPAFSHGGCTPGGPPGRAGHAGPTRCRFLA